VVAAAQIILAIAAAVALLMVAAAVAIAAAAAALLLATMAARQAYPLAMKLREGEKVDKKNGPLERADDGRMHTAAAAVQVNKKIWGVPRGDFDRVPAP
jgi:hypothetical protein